jgi:hypothetical protein
MKYVLLLIPCLLAVWVPLFNRIDPTLFDIPFFYWSLLVLIPVSSVFIWVASRFEGNDA